MLKVNFLNYKTLLIADIIEMPESLRAIHGFEKALAENEEYSIKSISYPAIGTRGKTLFLRGSSKHNDYQIPTHVYETQEDMAKAKYYFEEMIKQINEKYKDDDGICPF